MTANQLIDKFDTMTIDEMTPELGKIRQKIIDIKRSGPKGGLTQIEGAASIVNIITLTKLSHQT